MASAGDQRQAHEAADPSMVQSLTRLFETRPDLSMFEPRSLRALEDAACSRNSIMHTRAHLSHFDVEVLETLVASGPQTIDDLQFLAGDPPLDALETSLERLVDRWLVRADGDHWRTRHLGNLRMDHPVGLGRKLMDLASSLTAAEATQYTTKLGLGHFSTRQKSLEALQEFFADPQNMQQLYGDAPDEARELLASLAIGPPTVHLPYATAIRSAHPGAKWLMDRGLLFPSRWGVMELPREAGISLRLGRVVLESHFQVPTIALTSFHEDEAEIAQSALAAVALVEDICRAVNILKPVGLKSGGVGAREIKRIAAFLSIDEPKTYIALEIAKAADLLQLDVVTRQVPNKSKRSSFSETSWELRTTARHDEWILQSLGERWLLLVRSWLALEIHPSWSGRRDENNKLINALDQVSPDPTHACRRVSFMETIESLGSDMSITSELVELTQFIEWHAYILFAIQLEDAETYVGDLINEATILGVWVQGTITSPSKLALHGKYEEACRALDAIAPAVVDEITLQADGTVIIGGTPSPTLLQKLQSFADIATRDTALVMRITEPSLRRGLDGHVSANDMLEILNEYAPKGVPQALQYLIEDVDRRHGNIVVGAATSYVVADDPAVLADAARHKVLSKHKPRVVSPNVLVADATPEVLLQALRDAGFMPVFDDSSNTVKVNREYRTELSGFTSYDNPTILHIAPNLTELVEHLANASDVNSVMTDGSLSDAPLHQMIITLLAEYEVITDDDEIGFSNRVTDDDEIESFLHIAQRTHASIAFGLVLDEVVLGVDNGESNLPIAVIQQFDSDYIYARNLLDLSMIVIRRSNVQWAMLIDFDAGGEDYYPDDGDFNG